MFPSPSPAGASAAAQAVRGVFGALPDGRSVEQVELSNGALRARIITLGAALQGLEVPDRRDQLDDVVLGFDSAAEYFDDAQYFGVTVGRYANRIARSAFTLDGRRYQVSPNEGENSLHGGRVGFGKRLWTITAVDSGPEPSVTLAYHSPAGEEGYPGDLKVEATWALTARGELKLEYRAETDAPTVVNLSNHSYFNLAGVRAGEDMMDARLTLDADAYTPVDKELIPTGEIRPVAGTPFDFREAAPVGPSLRDGSDAQIRIGNGIDHNFVLRGEVGHLRRAARIDDPHSGRALEILTDSPGLQLYTGNGLNGSTQGKGGRLYRQGDALVLEPQAFPDSPNNARFPSTRLDPGQTYRNRIVYRFSATAP